MTIAGPGGTKNFFSDPPSGTVFALGSLVDVGPLQWPGGRLKREILRCYTFLPILGLPPKLRVPGVIVVVGIPFFFFLGFLVSRPERSRQR